MSTIPAQELDTPRGDPIAQIERRLGRPRPLPGMYSGNLAAVLERGWIAIKTQNWIIILSGFVEPVLYLLAM